VFGWKADGEAGRFEDATGHVIGHFMADLPVPGEAGLHCPAEILRASGPDRQPRSAGQGRAAAIARRDEPRRYAPL
jgi:hypothetical protein